MYNRILQFISTRIASYFQIVRECLYLKQVILMRFNYFNLATRIKAGSNQILGTGYLDLASAEN